MDFKKILEIIRANQKRDFVAIKREIRKLYNVDLSYLDYLYRMAESPNPATRQQALTKLKEEITKATRKEDNDFKTLEELARAALKRAIEMTAKNYNFYLSIYPAEEEQLYELYAKSLYFHIANNYRLLDPKLQSAVIHHLRVGSSAAVLAADLKRKSNGAIGHALNIARNELINIYSDGERVALDKAGCKKYIYHATDDQRTRRSHKERDGKIYTMANDPLQYREFNCRCTREAIFD